MKKVLLLAACAAGLVAVSSCSLFSPLSPPSWIVGRWSDQFSINTWEFTANDVIMGSGNVSVDLRKLYTTGLSDTTTSTSYTVVLSSGAASFSYEFDEVDGTTINYMVAGTPVPLTRQ